MKQAPQREHLISGCGKETLQMAVPEALNQAREKALKTQGARQTGSYQPSEQAVSAKVSTARLAKTTQQSNESLRRDAGPFGLCHCEVSVQEGTI